MSDVSTASDRITGHAARAAMERTGTFDAESAFDALLAEVEEKNLSIERIQFGIGTARWTEANRLINNIEHCILRSPMEEDASYPLKVLPDLRRLRRILKEADGE